MTQQTSELAKIEANLNTYDINPTFDIGNTAKAYKYFSETRNEWVFSIGFYTEGLGLINADEFATFENLIARMKDLSSGNLSLWHISEE